MTQLGRKWLVAAGVFGVAACTPAKTNVTLGAMLSQTGLHSSTGVGTLLSLQLAVSEINAAGGVLGGKLTIENEDDKSDPMQAVTSAKDLVNTVKVPAIVGTTGNETMVPAIAVTAPAGVVMISDLASGSTITNTATDNGTVFTTSADHVIQGTLLAERAYTTHGFHKCAIIQVAQPVPQDLANGFATKFQNLGGTITSNVTITSGQSSYQSTLQQIYAAATPDCILMATYVPDGIIITQNYLSGFTAKNSFWFYGPIVNVTPFFMGVGASNFTFGNEGADTGSGPGFTPYDSSFMTANPSTTTEEEPGTYDDVYLLALAIEAGGAPDGTTIKNNMRTIANPPGTVVKPGDWAMAVNLLKAGTKINYEGASGDCDFDANGAAAPPYVIWSMVNGQNMTLVDDAKP
jgi:ABC-type branched-subunit amino acid transport system substrate-binding protein